MSGSVREIAERSQRASRSLAKSTAAQRASAINGIADALEQNSADILRANAVDVTAAADLVARGEMSAATLDRLRMDDSKLAEMARSVRAVAGLADPLGRVTERTELDSELILDKVTCPLGVLAVIFEARPDAVTQISALALKSGNAVVLKAGREVERTATVLVEIIRTALVACDLAEDAVSLVVGREAVRELLAMSDMVDTVIPRGSKQLVEYVQANTRIPVLGHAEGICHVYVHSAADLEMAMAIVEDGKTDYPAACNATETLLVDSTIAANFLPSLAERLTAKGVRLRGCEKTSAIIGEQKIGAVAEDEWHTEYGDLVLAIRVVDGVEAAIDHIHRFGSRHTETIVTGDATVAERFLHEVDAAGVYHNASTRFADGYRYGFGAEVGISTSKLHARGPVGLEGLTTYKYLLRGTGQVARDYHGENARQFTHVRLPNG